MKNSIDTLFSHLWSDYIAITPSAEKIHTLLKAKTGSSHIVNDHVAFRTFNLPQVGLQKLAQHFEALGYKACGEYDFAAKKLNAKHYQHDDLTKPKVFISELRVDELSSAVQTIIHQMVSGMSADLTTEASFLYSGTHWQVSKAQYHALLAESEYAAWMAAWGYRANHFTVSVNHLAGDWTLTAVNDVLKHADFVLNTSGGEIKGGQAVCLAQSSTMADSMPVAFADETVLIPSCFYEFAERFKQPSGELYQGFVAASADKIFESTNTTT